MVRLLCSFTVIFQHDLTPPPPPQPLFSQRICIDLKNVSNRRFVYHYRTTILEGKKGKLVLWAMIYECELIWNHIGSFETCLNLSILWIYHYHNSFILVPPHQIIGVILFLSCLLSPLAFAITFELWKIQTFPLTTSCVTKRHTFNNRKK